MEYFTHTYLKKVFVVSVFFAAAWMGSTAQGATYEHEFQKDESLWFLAKVYFGKSGEYSKILKDNNLKSAGEVKAGQKLKIVDPMHAPGSEAFKARFEKLKTERATQLAAGQSGVSGGSASASEKASAGTTKPSNSESEKKDTATRDAVSAVGSESSSKPKSGAGGSNSKKLLEDLTVEKTIRLDSDYFCQRNPLEHPGCSLTSKK